MKIKSGYITNSSSTNFIIISKEKLTINYLYKKLGFKENSPLECQGRELCRKILDGTQNGLRWFDFTEYNYENVKYAFGDSTAKKLKKLTGKGYYVYAGQTDSESDALTTLFTLDSFEIDESDFYLNAKNCIW